ncbi:MAG: hypothetical protein JRJ74_06855 [Deltaproteobacteria bacterium]|nr:hypothetical protein [Deltaproteobacteria bacterium]
MIQLAEILPDKEIVMTLSRQLSWSHFVAVLPLKVDLQRDFYAEMCRYITELPKRELLEQKLHKAVEEFGRFLTSRQLKVKQKTNNVAGLQIADLVAHPSYRATLARKNKQSLPLNFGGEIAQILEKEKYYRSPNGRIDGWGRKCLP